MIMRFDFENRADPVADVHHSCILSGSLHHARPGGRQPLQMHARRFVRAVLAPHHTENSQLRVIRIAPQNLLNASVFLRRQAMLGRNFRRNFDFSLYRLLHFFCQGTGLAVPFNEQKPSALDAEDPCLLLLIRHIRARCFAQAKLSQQSIAHATTSLRKSTQKKGGFAEGSKRLPQLDCSLVCSAPASNTRLSTRISPAHPMNPAAIPSPAPDAASTPARCARGCRSPQPRATTRSDCSRGRTQRLRHRLASPPRNPRRPG